MTARRIGRRTVEVSREDKVLFPEDGITKRDLVDYYERIAEMLLPHVRDRPLVMQRFPDGLGEKGFYHKQVPDHFPDWIERARLQKEDGIITQVVCDEAATLVYLADQACITPHVWLSRRDEPRRPDRLVIDLDPSDDDFGKVREAARRVAAACEEAGLAVFLQLTGSRGVHVVCPLRRGPAFEATRAFARDLGERLTEGHPDLLTMEQRKNKRGDRVYVDVSRNAYGQTFVAPYAVRARPGAPVATPIRREELEQGGLSPRKYTIGNLFRRLAQVEDPWKGMGRAARQLPRS